MVVCRLVVDVVVEVVVEEVTVVVAVASAYRVASCPHSQIPPQPTVGYHLKQGLPVALIVVEPITLMTVVGVAAVAVTVTVAAEAVTVLGWKPAQAHALENFARSEQSHAHCGTWVFDSARLPNLAVIVVGPAAAAPPWVVVVVVVIEVLVAVVMSVETATVVLVIVRSVRMTVVVENNEIPVLTEMVRSDVTCAGVLVTVVVTAEGVTVTGLKRAAQSEDLTGA
jgi:hypothetical protein